MIGDLSSTAPLGVATEAAVIHSAARLPAKVETRWCSTADLGEATIANCHGIWIAPGSPYRDMAKVIWVIQQARERKIPCLGTCGGFQHMVIEYARNALGVMDAQHAEYDPYASRLIISRLACSLVGRQMTIGFVAGSRVAGFYGTATAGEEYYCNFGVNPEYLPMFAGSEFRIAGSDQEGEARVMEISAHPFFVGTLFVPQTRSTAEVPHPIVSAFVQAAHQAAVAESTRRTVSN